MDERFFGDEIRIESGDPAALGPLMETAIQAFARAAGGDPGDAADLGEGGRAALVTTAGLAPRAILLRIVSTGVEVRDPGAGDDEPLMLWSA